MPTLAPSRYGVSPSGELVLDDVRHGLLDAPGDCRDLDTVLAAARAADDGASCLVVPGPGADAPGRRHRSAAAQALAVLLATEHVTVALNVHAPAWDAAALARFATSTDGLGGGRLVLRVAGPGADALAEVVARGGTTTVVVPEGTDGTGGTDGGDGPAPAGQDA